MLDAIARVRTCRLIEKLERNYDYAERLRSKKIFRVEIGEKKRKEEKTNGKKIEI